MKYIFYFISIIVVTMLMMIIGHFKERTLPIELANRLYRKCSKVIIDYLKEHNKANINDIKKCITNISVSVFWSRKKLKVTNPAHFAEQIVQNLIKDGKLQLVDGKDNKRVYMLSVK